MPQLNVATYFSQIFWLFIFAIFVYSFVKYYIIPNFDKILDERNKYINDSLLEAKKIADEAKRIEDSNNLGLSDAYRKSALILKDITDECIKNLHQKILETEKELKIMQSQSENKITQFKESLNAEIDTLIQDSTKKILHDLVSIEITNTTLSKDSK